MDEMSPDLSTDAEPDTYRDGLLNQVISGGGTDGQDVGIFGGLYPYVATNGLPKGYPYYTKTIVGAKAVDGKVRVTLNVKIANE